MYLKSLELHGFKSFPNRTVLSFERGATVIVGPNGSGKSNISDAMRWVLGELSSRNIRGTKMEDVIFGGTDERRQMGFAEVSVTFDNTDPTNRLDSPYDEVVVTRRYYRTGESEYLINRQPKRLRDIYELFMNTGVGREGYSIIGQGKIAEIISKKSDERRNIFEEAAGISKFRHRKEEAERKLKQTLDNLDRVKDILGEKESRLGPLEKEAEKARKGLAFYEEKKRADVALWLYDTKKIQLDIAQAEEDLKLSRHELELLVQAIEDLQRQSDNLYKKAQENQLLSEQLYEEIRLATERRHALDNEIRVAESRYSSSAELIAQCRTRIAEIEETEKTVEKTKAEYDERLEKAKAQLEVLADEKLGYLSEYQKLSLEVQKARRELQEALDEMVVEENNATSLNVRIDFIENSRVQDGTRSHDIEEEIAKYEAAGVALKEEADRCEKKAAGFKAQIAEKDEIITTSGARIEELAEEKEQITELLNTKRVNKNTFEEKADALQRMNDHFEGYAESIKFVMKEYRAGHLPSVGRIHGPLSSLISINKEYITAIETALGNSLQNIIVDNEETAKAAIGLLKRNNAGRATFYPISAIRPYSETDEIKQAKAMQGFIGRADTLVESDEKYRSIVEFLLLRTLVFDNIDNASVAAKKIRYKVKIVTLDGQVINTGGAFTGGSAKRDSGILSRVNTINELREKAAALATEIEATVNALSEIDTEVATLKEAVKEAEQHKTLLVSLSTTEFSALETANANYNANKNIIEKLTYDFNNLIGQQAKAEEDLKALRAEYTAALERIEALKAFRSKRAEEMGVQDERCDELNDKANAATVRIAEATKDIESIEQLISTVDGRLSELAADKQKENERIDEISKARDNIDVTRAENSREYEEIERQITELNSKRREAQSGRDEFEAELNRIRERQKDRENARVSAADAVLRGEHKVLGMKEKQDTLGSELWDEYEITYEQAVALDYPPVTAENYDEISAQRTSVRSKLRFLGHYNPDSISEYAQVKEEYDKLNTQYTDLTSSYEELTDIISRLEGEMRTSFVTAFEAINRNFGITFKELFGGGNAELSLTDPEDVLTSGIEIKAAPPGKIIKNLSLLSGGEQSFVAIALLFAILKVNPTPFCILDEIEAALDEVNVFRFGEYIKKFDDGTQFILITHRRGTMEIGDRLYGVTMPQRGISQAIELNVNEIEGKQKELLDGVL